MNRTADVVIIGAGIAGVSAAYHLAVRHNITDVVIVDPRPPLTLTSDKSTECYRNWWPSAPMVRLMNRSIDIFEELSNEADFGFNQRGYLFVTAEQKTFDGLEKQVRAVAQLGAKATLLDAEEIQSQYPIVTPDAVGAIRIERAGWFRAQDLGQWMLERAREQGADLITSTVIDLEPGQVTLADGSLISAGDVVIAAGPLASAVALMAGIELPLFSELHLKVAFKDHLGVIPREAPMTIWNDPQTIEWSDEERSALEEMGRDELLGDMPIYCHFRPEGGDDSPYVVALWEYHDQVMEPRWPLPEDPLYPEVVMRGLTTMVPDLSVYRDRLPSSVVDGGYYTKTPENRPLIGPSGVDRVHLLVGYSGFGVMVSAGGADLLAHQILGGSIPDYADAFALSRYDDPEYVSTVESAATGQL